MRCTTQELVLSTAALIFGTAKFYQFNTIFLN
jgi:hypothetical protein